MSAAIEVHRDGPWELPRGWVWARLGDVSHHPGRIDPARQLQGNFRYIDLSAIDDGVVGEPAALSAVQAPSRARQSVKAGDTLLSCVRVYLRNNAIVPTNLDGAVASTAFCVLRPGGAIDPRFLFWYVHSRKFTEILVPLQRGNSPPAVLDADVRDQLTPIPPLAEQQRIVARIDELFTEIADGETALKRARTDLGFWRRSLLKAAVTGELTSEWRDSHSAEGTGADLVRLASEAKLRASAGTRRGRRIAAEDLADDTSFDDLPSTWTTATFGELFNLFTGSTPSRSEARYWGGDVPWVSSGEVAFCRIVDTDEKITPAGLAASSTRLHPPGTVLLAMIGEGKTRGQPAILDIAAANNQNAAAIRVAETPILPE